VNRYLAECYWPGMTVPRVAQTVQRVQRAAETLTVEGIDFRYVSAFVVPEDEIAFCLFDAGSKKVVEEACRRADLPCDRILLVAQIPSERAW
jgi:hypothetical protein